MVFVIIIVCICFYFTILSRRFFGTYRNHYTLFNCWWGGLTLLSYLNLSPLYLPSDYLYSILAIGTLSFNLSLYTRRISSTFNRIEADVFHLNYRTFLVLQLLVAYFLFPYVLRGILITSEESMAALKAGIVDTFADSPGEVIKIYWFCEPMIISSMIISCFLFYFKKGRLAMFSIGASLLNMTLYSFAFGGRIQMFRMALLLMIFLAFKYLIKSDRLLVARRTKSAIYVIAMIVVVMAVFTVQRSWSGDSEFYKMFNIYTVGSFSLFDHFLQNPSISQLESNLLYGRATMASFLDPFILFFSRVFGVDSLTTRDMGVNIINNVQEEFYTVGSGYSMNAFSTMYYPFMRDFGLGGVILFPFLLGYLLNLLIYQVLKRENFYLFLIYIMLCYILLFASNRWEFVNFWPFGASMYIFILTRRWLLIS